MRAAAVLSCSAGATVGCDGIPMPPQPSCCRVERRAFARDPESDLG